MTVVRPATTADAAGIRAVIEEAFAGHGLEVVAMVEALDAAGHTRASLVAEVDGVVVGHVQVSHSWLDARRALVDVLVLSPLGVLPAHHGKGVGTELLAAAVAWSATTGAPALFLEGSPHFYGARGWQRGSSLGFERPSVRVPDPAFQVVTFPSREDWMTGRLVYCDPFWALDCVGLRDPRLASLEEAFGDL